MSVYKRDLARAESHKRRAARLAAGAPAPRPHWAYRKVVRLADGSKVRIQGVPDIDTKDAAQRAERAHVERTLHPPEKECSITVADFAPVFLDTSRVGNKHSTVIAKEQILRDHLIPFFGSRRLAEVSYALIEDFKVEKAGTHSIKTVNNLLTVLRRMLVVARKRGHLAVVPEVEWLRLPEQEFDFLSFEEAERLIDAAPGESQMMILLALRSGLRLGELLALRWQDLDLKAGRIFVRRNWVKGKIGTPKSGKAREVDLGDDAINALKRHRHLRGELVFCQADGSMLTIGEPRWYIRRACKLAGIREVGWHVLRHSYASHLVMRGAPLKAVQDLLGHATIQMTMRYAHLSPAAKRDAARLLDRRGTSVARKSEIERK